jgi:hypothetical protein
MKNTFVRIVGRKKRIVSVNQMKSSQNELFRWADQISMASWNELRNRPPRQAAEAVGAEWDGKIFKLPLLGIQYTIDPAQQRIGMADNAEYRVSYQAGIVLLTTLSSSKGVPPSGRMAVPQELPGGRMFFTGAHAVATGQLAKYFEKDSAQLLDRAREIGGEVIEGAGIFALTNILVFRFCKVG